MPDNLPKLKDSTMRTLAENGMAGMIPQIRLDLAVLAREVGVPVDSDEDVIRAAALKANSASK